MTITDVAREAGVSPSSSYLSAMLLGVLEQARRSDTQIVVVECDDEADGMRCIRNMIKTGIDGILLSPPLADSPAVPELLRESGTHCVTIGTRRDEPNISSVSIDDFAAAKLMTEHIIGFAVRAARQRRAAGQRSPKWPGRGPMKISPGQGG